MNNKKIIIGSHVSLKSPEYFLGSVKEALSYKANTFMIYTGAPQNTIRKDTSTFKIDEALVLMKENNIKPESIIVHAPYIINLCSSKEETRQLAVEFLTKELIRTEQFHSNKLVLHPGCMLNQEYCTALRQVIDGINKSLKNANNNVIILLETMAGKGTEIARNLNQIKDIIEGIEQKEKIGICLDTCHLSDSGIDISNFDEYLDQFENIIGIDKILCIHINDSKNPISAHKDRHENIGYGYIGFSNLINVIYNKKLLDVPKILETPYVKINKSKDSIAPYKKEIEMIKNKLFENWLNKEIIKK